jgi:NAD+ kinase
MQRIGLVVHPSRPIERPLEALHGWADARGVDVVQLRVPSVTERVVAPYGEVATCDLVVAIGGDGTVLAALRASAPAGTPVLGISCGSLGALTAVGPGESVAALERYADGTWVRRPLPALVATVDGADDRVWAINDIVLVRQAAQLMVDVTIEGELYARMAGDGVIVSTPLGSSAYAMAAGGPLLVEGTEALVVTPLVIHGGSIPPLVVRGSSSVVLDAHPNWGGMELEVDGQHSEVTGSRFVVRLAPAMATLVVMSDPGVGLAPLRSRGLIADSPRVKARDARDAREHRAGS